MTTPPKTAKLSAALPWASLVCGLSSWALTPVLFLGLDVIAIVLGLMALKLVGKDMKTERRVAILGLLIGGAKLLFVMASTALLLLAFMKNPVAH